ncbi:MAG: Gfo/Idh/MocA family oxidoreductase [Candidatus Woesearchaeota archaeon]|nr:Gfo/Idh/MocA family oxidoreductase [Candidatus Woesearchaeota archaeon]
MEPKKIALFGCGGFAQNHIREISKWNNVVIAYLIDPSLENRERSAGVYKDNRGVSPQGFSSLDSFISSDPSFDAGVVVTPPDTHFEISESVLNSGKSVYVEKPFTVSVEDAIKLNSLAKQNGVDITIGANRCVLISGRTQHIQLQVLLQIIALITVISCLLT